MAVISEGGLCITCGVYGSMWRKGDVFMDNLGEIASD